MEHLFDNYLISLSYLFVITFRIQSKNIEEFCVYFGDCRPPISAIPGH